MKTPLNNINNPNINTLLYLVRSKIEFFDKQSRVCVVHKLRRQKDQLMTAISIPSRLFLLIIISLTSLITLSGCGFHLRGTNADYKLPFSTVYLDCKNVAICPNLQSAIKLQKLTTLVSSQNPTTNTTDNKNNMYSIKNNTQNNAQEPITTIQLLNEQTSRDPQNFSSVGRIAAYILTYQVQAIILQNGLQIGSTITVSAQSIMQYNDSVILSSSINEGAFWDNLHQSVTNQLIRRLVAFKK
jgi:LPS-assembly lipoprotein